MTKIISSVKEIFNSSKEWFKVGLIVIGIVALSKFISLFFAQLLVFLGL